VRFCKLALDNNISGSLFGPSAWLMKSPPEQYHDDIAHRMAEEFIAQPMRRPMPLQTPRSRQAVASRPGVVPRVPKVSPTPVAGNGGSANGKGADTKGAKGTPPARPRARATKR